MFQSNAGGFSFILKHENWGQRDLEDFLDGESAQERRCWSFKSNESTTKAWIVLALSGSSVQPGWKSERPDKPVPFQLGDSQP